MRFTLLKLLAASPAFVTLVLGQTYTLCNPMEKTCPKDPALGGNYEHIFGGAAPGFTATGSGDMIFYKSDGAHFRIEKTNDAPTITSNFYIMYGKLDVVLRAAPGAGIVSSLVLLSDVLDEIDWEWIGSDINQAQSNYFGKGNTKTYDRGGFHPVKHQEFHDYGIEWTPQFIKWSIDGTVVRTLTPDQVKGDFYPQTPMQIKVGSWSGGDPKNAKGVIEWAQGPTDYSKGPFDMIVKSIKIQDYSTGTYYYYSDRTGSSASIRSEGGKIMNGPSNKPPNNVSDLPQLPTTTPTPNATPNPDPTPTPTPTTTPRGPRRSSGDIRSATTKSTKPTTTTGDSDEETTTDNTKTTLPPTTTPQYSSTGFYTSTHTVHTDSTAPKNTSIPSATQSPLPTDNAAAGTLDERFRPSLLMAIAGMVGVGLVL